MTTEGERIKLIRKSLGFTQKEFAKLLGFGESYMSRIETNVDQFSRDKLLLLSQAYNVSIDWLFSGEGSMFRNSQQSNDELRKVIKTEVNDLLQERGL